MVRRHLDAEAGDPLAGYFDQAGPPNLNVRGWRLGGLDGEVGVRATQATEQPPDIRPLGELFRIK